jgi:hypothetical protein
MCKMLSKINLCCRLVQQTNLGHQPFNITGVNIPITAHDLGILNLLTLKRIHKCVVHRGEQQVNN